ncbi:MAG: hypothetical protein ACLQBA_09480 [Candidatus Binataceae bacterium]
MAIAARGPFTLKGALVTIDATTQNPTIIAFQYNPATLKRTLRPQMVGGEEQDRSLAVRFKGAPVETIAVDIEIDATDALDAADPNATTMGIYPQMFSLELLAYPQSTMIVQQEALLNAGIIEIAPIVAPRTLFVWGSRRVLPVRLIDYTIAEEAFDTQLNPIQATVSLNMRVLNYTDLDSSNRGYADFLAYQQGMEAVARQAPGGNSSIGINPRQY